MQTSIGTLFKTRQRSHRCRVKDGYLLSGPLTPSHRDADIDVLHIATTQSDDTRFWDIEQVGTSLTAPSKVNSAEQIRNFIDSSVHRDSDGSYVIGFPWNTDHPPPPSNRSVYEKRA